MKSANSYPAATHTTRLSLKPLFLLLCLTWISIFFLWNAPVQAAPSGAVNPYDLIAAVNQLRAANGLPPYNVNSALMVAAQGHSEYQASIGQGTHTGAGGSRPRDRAAAAGYGGGATIYVSENIAWGSNMTAQGAVAIWQGDSLHLNTLLSKEYTDVGAGVATAGGVTYLTLDVGYIAGNPGSGGMNPTDNIPAAVATADFNPVITATPNPDGSIVHVVEPGQTLWTIAVIYQISIPELKRLNNLITNTIYVGQKLVIKPAAVESAVSGTAGPSTATSPAELLPPTPTRPFPTPLPTDTPIASFTPPFTPTAEARFSAGISQQAIPILIAVLILGGLLLIIVGKSLK